ncbi:MAG: 4-(cytidine 5'-diphospho)-2-C-methyl-D-erythritol kinase [Spirochaetes bacterium]|nr:4-(cytidine 5'-diphospho)-2-C-methyl-D-erythritol kinase [Spirochaetota bacterium]
MADSIKAHAKVNLHLEVLNRRDDGYHNIFSLMASVALHDLLKLEDLTLRESRGPINVMIRNAGGSHGEVIDAVPVRENLITRATTGFLDRLGMSGTVAYSIEKNIPSGAGLGGGSSDAAAACKLLNTRLNAFSPEELGEIGVSIGADVPYCLRGGFALCRGTGEIVMQVPGRLTNPVLIAHCAIHIDTGQAYGALGRPSEIDREREAAAGKTTRRLTSALVSGSAEELRSIAVNDFELPVFQRHPRIARLKEKLYKLGAVFATMTGSGSSVIALFSSKEEASRAQEGIREDCSEVMLTRFV